MRTHPADPLDHGSPMDVCGCCGGTGVLSGLVPVDFTGDPTCQVCGGSGNVFILAGEQTSRYPLTRTPFLSLVQRHKRAHYRPRKGTDEEGDPNR